MDIIYTSENHEIVIQCDKARDPEYMALLDRTMWGTLDTKYTMHGLDHDIAMYKNPTFVCMRENNRLIGGMVINEKKIMLDRENIPAFYVSLFVVVPERAGRGYGTLLLRETSSFVHGKIIRQMKRGIASSVNSGADALGMYKNLTDDEIKDLENGPLHISVTDSL
jgi:hypothetical protein